MAYKPHKLPDTYSQARRAGLDGRKGNTEFINSPELVSAQDREVLQGLLDRLGWDDARLQSWLDSKHSPFADRESKRIRTTADANKVRWALKGMLSRAGKWEKAA